MAVRKINKARAVKKSGSMKKIKPAAVQPAATATAVKTEPAVNEKHTETLLMSDVTRAWKDALGKIKEIDIQGRNKKETDKEISNTLMKWNDLNPFLQNQRIKNLYTGAKKINKTEIGQYLENPGNYESALRGVAWSQSASQQIYYNILRHAADIPQYKYYKIPELLDEENYSKPEFQAEDRFTDEWLETLNIPNTFKTIALEVKREGKSSYFFRNKFDGKANKKAPKFVALQKLPTEWVKITGKGLLGYTVSFNMMYFLNIANDPEYFGDFFKTAWEDMVQKGIVTKKDLARVGAKYEKGKKVEVGDAFKYELNLDKARSYKFAFEGNEYTTMIEGGLNGNIKNYLFWLQLPFDMCYTFGSDNSQPWVAPDTMGLLMQLQELNDYKTLAGLISSTPLTAVLTGEIDTIQNPRAGKNDSIFSPEVVRAYEDAFNSATSTNIEAWMWPAKNIKLQQLNSDVNSSEILQTATENFISAAGEGGLTAITDKPNIGQVTVAKQLAAEQQRYVTLQFERVVNYILKYKIQLKYDWKVKIWGDIFNMDNDRKFLKELVAGGALMFLPKLLSAEDISMRDTKSVVNYIKTLDFYKDLATFSMIKQNELTIEAAKVTAKLSANTKTAKTKKADDGSSKASVGRPAIADGNVNNDATAASKAAGTNTRDNRNQFEHFSGARCPICGAELMEGQTVCEECAEKIKEENE